MEFELCRTLSRVVRFPEKRPIAEIDDGPLQLSSRGDKTAIELFLAEVRPMIETLPLAKAEEAYKRMMAGKARFRMVLTMT